MAPPTLIALLHGPDQPGLVARVAGWIFTRGGNILVSPELTQIGVKKGLKISFVLPMNLQWV
jgi:formyltetrahydrofolate hydrolase